MSSDEVVLFASISQDIHGLADVGPMGHEVRILGMSAHHGEGAGGTEPFPRQRSLIESSKLATIPSQTRKSARTPAS
jgi:hypothetical protein